MDVVVIGTVVMDITAKPIAGQNTWKEKQRIEGIRLSTGGDAANQSIRLADLGRSVAVAACGEIGRGDLVEFLLRRGALGHLQAGLFSAQQFQL